MTPSVPARNPVVRFDADTFVRDAPSTAGRILGIAKRGHALPYADVTAENGWMKVWYRGEAGWVGRGSLGTGNREQGTGNRQ